VVADALNVAKDLMALMASAMLLYVPLKLRRLYKLRINIKTEDVRSKSLRHLIKGWIDDTDRVIEHITQQDFINVLIALGLLLISAMISFVLSLLTVCDIKL
jgi:hypothetical protein